MQRLTILVWGALAIGACKKEGATAGPSDAVADEGPADDDLPPIDEGQSRVSEAEADPVLTASSFEDTVGDHMQEVVDCYTEAQSKKASLKGKLVARFHIGPEGKVQSVEAAEGSTLTDAGLLGCIQTRAAAWQFERTPSGEAMPMEFPFDLAPG